MVKTLGQSSKILFERQNNPFLTRSLVVMANDKPDLLSSKVSILNCIPRRVYRIRSRNLRFGVYDGNEGFIGIRLKFGARFLFTEYHWDQGPPFGTVSHQLDLGIDLPEEIPLALSLGTVDEESGRPVNLDQSIGKEGRGWFFLDTNQSSPDIKPVNVPNKALFDFLEEVERKYA